MRLWIPGISSQRLQFSNRFQNLGYVLGGGGLPVGAVSVDRGADLSGGGYIVFGARGADEVWQLPWWSVFVDFVAPAAGSARTLVSCSHPVTGDRMELGLSALNELQCIGTTTVVSDDVVTAGRHKGLFIYTGGVIEFWVDGVRIGTSTVTLSSGSPTTLFVGVASDGTSRKLGTTIYKLDVYSYPLDENEAFGVSAIEGWTPRSLLGDYGGDYANGLYWDGDEDGAYEPNTQPTLRNLDFTQGTTIWSLSGAGTPQFTIQPGRTSAMLAGRVRRGTGGNATIGQVLSIIGDNRIRVRGYARADGVTAAFPRVRLNASVAWTGVASHQWQQFDADETSNGNAFYLYVDSGTDNVSYADWTQLQVDNLSCKGLNPYTSGTLAGSKFAQATAAKMPWNSTSGGLQFETGDEINSTAAAAAWKFMHYNPVGNYPVFTLAWVFDALGAAGGNYLFRTRYSLPGIWVYRNTANTFSVSVQNNSTQIALLGGTLINGSGNNVMVLRSDGVNLTMHQSSALAPTSLYSGTQSSTNNAEPLGIGYWPYTAGSANGKFNKIFAIDQALTPAETQQLGRYLAHANRLPW